MQHGEKEAFFYKIKLPRPPRCPCSRLSSRRLVGGFISRMTLVLAGSTVIPSLVIRNPKTFQLLSPESF